MSKIIKVGIKYGLLAGVILFGLIQLVPYGRQHTNPPVVQEPNWDDVQTRQLAVEACYDCHSNEVNWPWYSNVAPVSWLVQRHVNKGRRELNFSEWEEKDNRPKMARELSKEIRKGKMPLRSYLITHPEARLTSEQRQQLVDGLTVTVNGQ